MPPVPKKKHTRSRSNKRRQINPVNLSNLSKCPNCGKLRFSHTQCEACGYSYTKTSGSQKK